MKNRRSIFLLSLIVVLLAGAHFLLHRYDAPVRSERRRTLLETEAAVNRLKIVRRGAAPIELVRSRSWRMTSPYSSSAETGVVLKLLDALAYTPVSDAYADADLLRLGRTRSDFALETPPVELTVGDERGGSTVISFGSPTPTGDSIYAAVSDADAVFVVSSSVLAAADLPAESFRRRSVFPAGMEAPLAFDIKRGAASLQTFERKSDGWVVGGELASSPKVKEYLDRLMSADAVDFVWPIGASNETEHAAASLLSSYELDPESAVTITLKGANGAGRQISFGKAADEHHVYALVHNGGAIVTLPAELKDIAVKAGVKLTDSRLFPVEKSAISSFTVSDGTVVCALARGEKNDWRLESPISAPADPDFVGTLLDRLVTFSPADLDPDGVQVSLGTNLAPVMVSARRLFGRGDFASFRSRRVLAVDPSLVRRLVGTPGGKDARPTVAVYNRERRTWGLETESESGAVDEKAIASVLKAISSLTADRIVKLKAVAADLDDYGLDVPSFTLAVDQDREDAVRRNLLIGGKVKGGGRYATIGSSDAVFVLSDETVERLTRPFVVGR